MTNNNTNKEDNTIYFQPPGIKPQFCEVGIIHESDPDHIWYLNEPCKIPIEAVKIIPKEKILYDRRTDSYIVYQ